MAPKKKNQKTKPSSSISSSSSTGPKLQISAENEQRLRRLLLNNSSTIRSEDVFSRPSERISKEAKGKRLRSVYEKLSCEGFRDDQIELALSSLNDGAATLEAALDWLCLNLPGNELPLKFASGTSATAEGVSISIISTARKDWVPSVNEPQQNEEQEHSISFKIKERKEDVEMDSRSQADWIRRYMEQEDEDDWESLVDDVSDCSFMVQASDPGSRAINIAKEYQTARLEAADAKQRKDKKSQEQAGHKIRKLKQEMSELGLSEDILEAEVESVSAPKFAPEDIDPDRLSSGSDFVGIKTESLNEGNFTHDFNPEVFDSVDDLLTSTVTETKTVESEDPDVELGGLFSEDASASIPLPQDVMKMQKKEKKAQYLGGNSKKKKSGLIKKEETKKIPKAVLHQLCQNLGWEAPRFNRVPGTDDGFRYTVSVLRTSTGRGKSRKAGGLITLQLPEQEESFTSAEDAQNRVAAFALHHLFPENNTDLLITEPYSSFVTKWQEEESSTKVDDNAANRRATFVDSLLGAESSRSSNPIKTSLEKLVNHQVRENLDSGVAAARAKRLNDFKAVESSNLRREQENKMKIDKYKKMLEFRAGLPIAALKKDILQLLKENDVLVVCGETGCGKTTQVPQFVLDEMIEAGEGGYCNIVCTQPRRIAAISVAERVADERCESAPGSDDSLVGFQVRLESARNDKTKLLFCTTGILLRKLAANTNLDDVTHVIVDEVHERSLLGDFLLIVLKDLIEKQSAQSSRKLKVILMSATVDSDLFSRYFGNCPVLTAQGRTHPVSTYFLEDVYDNLKYCLASDSLASVRHIIHAKEKVRGSTKYNNQGKKNLVLSSWGDDDLLSENFVNPNYDSSAYEAYSERTRENLKSLIEDVIDYDLLEDLVCHIDDTYPAGAILVFLPGVAEIHLLLDKLAASYRFGGLASEWLLPLYSSLASGDQRKVFLTPPENIRKVIIATDIAETSITIDDVIYVVDCGKHKENRYNPQKKLSSMVEDWISRANARQRCGRAGRVKPGICFCLYTRYRYESLMRPFQVPEMLRMPLVELCLQIKSLSLGYIKQFLSKAIEPPREEAMMSAIAILYEVGAIQGDEELTPLGYHLAKLPVDVLIGKMMIFGGIFCCLSPILSVSACLSYKSPFIYPKDERQKVENAKLSLLSDKLNGIKDLGGDDRRSDHLVMVVAYNKWAKILHEKGAKAAQGFCNSCFLSSSVMYMIRDMRIQLGSLLGDIGLIRLPKSFQTGRMKDTLDSWFADMRQPFNINSQHSSVVKSILCAGLYPNVAATEDGILGTASDNNLKPSASTLTSGRSFWYDGRREVYIHPTSINNNIKARRYPFLVYLEKVETNKVFLRDTSIISPYSILLYGGSINIQHQTGLIIIDGWLKLTAPAQTAVLFKELRLTLHSVLKELIRKPELATVADNEVIRSIVHLLLEEDKAQ